MSTQSNQPQSEPISDHEPSGRSATEIKAQSLRLPSLDGWRALSILLVLGNHSLIIGCNFDVTSLPMRLAQSVFDGNLGVRFFFVISGFLITWLLANEFLKWNKIDLVAFYIRRAIRILPVYIAFLLSLLILQLVSPFLLKWQTWLTCITFTVDFFPADIHSDGVVTGHFWSLSVEEQFYLVWPTILLLCSARSLFNWRLCIALAIPVITGPTARLVRSLYLAKRDIFHGTARFLLDHMIAFGSFFDYCDSLAIGCICSLLLLRFRSTILFHLKKRFRVKMGCAVAFIVLPQIIDLASSDNIINYYLGHFTQSICFFVNLAFGNSLQAVGFAVLMTQSVLFPNSKPYFLLNLAAIAWVGRLSYSIYIWQQIFWMDPKMYGLGNVWWMSFPGWLVPVMIVASISYYGLEMPFLKLREFFRRNNRSAAVPKPNYLSK